MFLVALTTTTYYQIDTNGEQSRYQLHERISTWKWLTAMTAFPIQ